MFDCIFQLLLILVVFVIFIEIKKWLITRKMGNFGSPRLIPFLGQAMSLLGKSNDQIIDMALDYFTQMQKTPFFVWAGPMLVVVIAEPEDLKIVLTNPHCLHKPYVYDHLFCKTSLIASTLNIWKRDRRALNNVFSAQHLRNYLTSINQKSRILAEKFQPFLGKSGDLYQTIFIGMLDMAIATMFGLDMNFQNERGALLYSLIRQIMHSLQYRVTRIWLRWDFIYFHLSKVGREVGGPLKAGNLILNEIYEKKVTELSQESDFMSKIHECGANSFIEQCLLMEEQGILTHDNLLDQMRLILIAGSDTTAMAIFGTLLMLAINPKHQERVIEELRSIFETEDCDVTLEHLNDMKYTERAIKESMRLLPPSPFIARQNSVEIELPKGTLPKNSVIIVNTLSLHRNPKVWGENVLEFDPDRFLPENVAKRPPFSYNPFSNGPRNCIAMKYAMMSVKSSLAHLLRRYKFSSDLCFPDIRLVTHLVTEIGNENPVRVEKRNF